MLILPQFIYKWILEYYNDYNHNNDYSKYIDFYEVKSKSYFRIYSRYIMAIVNFSLTNCQNLKMVTDLIYNKMLRFKSGCIKYTIPAIISLIKNNENVCKIENRIRPYKNKFELSLSDHNFELFHTCTFRCFLCHEINLIPRSNMRLCQKCHNKIKKPIKIQKAIFEYPLQKKNKVKYDRKALGFGSMIR